MSRRRGEGRARGRTPRTVPARSVRAGLAMLLLVPQLAGCYHYVPVSGGAVTPGTDLSLAVTDRGRVEVAPLFGPGVRRIGGTGLQSTDSSLVLSVTSVNYLDSSAGFTWTGERVELSRDLIVEVRERRLSRSRTWLAAALVVAGAVVASTIAITGFGADPGSDRPGGGDPGTQ